MTKEYPPLSDSRIPAASPSICAELLHARQLRLSIDPASLGFASTAELVNEPFSWIGQQRAQAAAEFGLGLDQPDYHLFVLGEEGSGRTSLLRQAMQAEAARRPAAPDIAFVHNFAVPERPLAVRLPAGQGRILKKRIEGLIDKLPEQLDKAVNEAQHRRQIEQLYNQARLAEEAGFASLRDWAGSVGLRIRREEGQLVVESATDPAENADSTSPIDPNAQPEPGAEDSNENFEENEALAQYDQAPLAINTVAISTETTSTEAISAAAPAESAVVVQLNLPAADSAPQAAASAEAPISLPATDEPPPPTVDLEYQLRLQLAQFRGQLRQAHIARDAALHLFYQSLATPLWQAGAAQALDGLSPAPEHAATLQRWLSQMQAEWLKNMALWVPRSIAQDADALLDATDSIEGEGESQDARDDARARLEARRQALRALSQLNLVVDHHGETRAPVITEDQPSLRNLFGTIDPPEDDEHRSDFSCIRAGSVLRADGGFLLLHLRDMVGDEACWQALRRVLRTRQLRIDDVHAVHGPSNSGAMQPELLPLHFKLVLVGSEESYYQMQEHDPDMARRFRVKVDFAEHFKATTATYRATAALMAQRCALYQLPHCDASAVARLLEQSHREADDQQRQSGQLNQLEALLIESAQRARQSGTGRLAQASDVEAALAAHRVRHNAMEEALHDAITEGEHVISFAGSAVGQLNGLSQIDTGDHRFGLPARITARTYAGQEGVLNIEREVALSGPIHDKGVLILQSYLTALFGHLAPLALNASVVFEQEYSGVEGDSASCAELYALLSALSGVPLAQGIAVTGALNQHGQVLPVGGINEKVEGWFKVCEAAGLDGTQGALIPARNLQQLMLDRHVIEAVAAGRFHIYTAGHVSDGMAVLTSQAPEIVANSVLARAEQTLRAFRRACQVAGHTRLRSASRLHPSSSTAPVEKP